MQRTKLPINRSIQFGNKPCSIGDTYGLNAYKRGLMK